MKVISQGEPDVPGKPVWVNKTITCNCGFSAVLRETDKKKFKVCNELGVSSFEGVLLCPSCGREIQLNLRAAHKP